MTSSSEYSDAEATRRMEAGLRRALNTPHKPNQAFVGKKPKRDSTKARKVTRRSAKPK